MEKIKDRLTNLDISTNYKDKEFWLMRSDFLGAFAYWVVRQSPYETPEIGAALSAFAKYVYKKVKYQTPEKFTYKELHELINEKVFEGIPEIEKLNHPKIDKVQNFVFVTRYSTPNPDYDFIDLSALARNVFYMIMREIITQGQ